jgi:hypothetical protein
MGQDLIAFVLRRLHHSCYVGSRADGALGLETMCFEYMRVLDMAHYWVLGTHVKYQMKLSAINRFERDFDLDRRIL